jgi:anaerobic dimethyl sulfoxide reductase subunit B (iron-sulfur subunit)
MQIGFFFDQTRCIGCYNCAAACRSWKELDPQVPDLIQIVSRERGTFPQISLSYSFITCCQCVEPACVSACPEEIFVKRDHDGVVIITDHAGCTSCELCVESCAFNALKVAPGQKWKIVKCDMCLDRLSEGKAPACVAACPTEALGVGPMELLIQEHEKFLS